MFPFQCQNLLVNHILYKGIDKWAQLCSCRSLGWQLMPARMRASAGALGPPRPALQLLPQAQRQLSGGQGGRAQERRTRGGGSAQAEAQP